jgi:1-acyl-sn-glycerol-3-phosphate acyltransferase
MLAWRRWPGLSRWLARRWAQRTLDRFGIELRVRDHSRGRAAGGGCLFVILNQTSLSEVLAQHIAFPGVRWVINIEFALLPLLGWAPWAMGGVVLLRRDHAQSTRALAEVTAGLRRGDSFGISIEGRRVRPNERAPYKKGPAVLAIAAQADIVPFVVRGADEVWRYGDWRPQPGTIEVELLEPIATRGLTYADRDALIAELRRRADLALARIDV